MNRKAFLLGFYSIGGQVLLLRELVSSLHGDELFLGTALFGWLLSVASGAYLAGKSRLSVKTGVLFVAGAIALPVMLVIVRLSTLMTGHLIGEITPFSTAAAISIIFMFPIGLISGALFSAITREGYRPALSIVQVYLWEGIGAFVGGGLITLLVGSYLSTLAMALVLSLVVVLILFFDLSHKRTVMPVIVAMALVALIKSYAPYLDRYIDNFKYRPYQIESSFDTHYGHQVILSKDSTLTLVTDNSIEAAYPDLLTAENLLLPPLAYRPDIKNILHIGRIEFGIMQLVDSLPGIKITAIDPRGSLTDAVEKIMSKAGQSVQINDDPLAYFTLASPLIKYDLIIMNIGEPDSYRSSRYLTARFLNAARRYLAPGGIIFFPSHYDTDRNISQEKGKLLSIIYNTLKSSFTHVASWPGDLTLFFASDSALFEVPVDTILQRFSALGYAPRFLNQDYLPDRFESLKVSRLHDALNSSSQVNSQEKPVLVYNQAIYRSKIDDLDKTVIPALYRQPWTLAVPLMIIVFFLILIFRKRRRREFGLFLYFVAGLVSLSLELISFYVFQSSAGSLYSQIGALIGAFMLGLALGTYFSVRANKEHLEFPALLLFIAAILFFSSTYRSVPPRALLLYHLLFLFTVAVITGSLFVAATARYYFGRSESNRGAGYALELVGSALGALLPITILLPFLGIPWLLASLLIFLVLSLVGATITR